MNILCWFYLHRWRYTFRKRTCTRCGLVERAEERITRTYTADRDSDPEEQG